MNQKNFDALLLDAANHEGIDGALFSDYVKKNVEFSKTMSAGDLTNAVYDAAASWRKKADESGSDAGALAAEMGAKTPQSKQEQAAAIEKLAKQTEIAQDKGLIDKAGDAWDAAKSKFSSFSDVMAGLADFFGQFAANPLLIPLTLAAFFIIWFSMQNIARAK